ncbi:MAG: ArsR/SmtB family transcription factor [Candidatus Bathyarchaeia archaeon]
MRRDILIIKDPEVAKLFADETRRRMLHRLRHHELSTADLARALGKSHSSIVHHLNLLKEAGLVEETRVERKRNLVQTFYRSTAKKFIISYSLTESLTPDAELLTWRREMLNRILEGLEAFGVEVPESERERVIELLEAYHTKEQKTFEEVVEQQVKPIALRGRTRAAIIRLLTRIKLSRDEEHARTVQELGELLRLPSELQPDEKS